MLRYREYGDRGWLEIPRRGGLVLPPPRPRWHHDLRDPDTESVLRAVRRVPTHGAGGDIKEKYGTITTFDVTNLQALASSSTFLSGWTSAYVVNTTNLNQNSVAYGQVTAGTNPTAGSVRTYMYAYDGTNAQTFTSAGTPGTEGTLTITDSEQLDAFLVLIWSSDIDTTTNDVYPMPPRSVRQAFGFYPRNWALYVSHNTVAALKAATGSSFFADHELTQYT